MQIIDRYIKPHLHPRLTASPYAYRDFKAALYGVTATTVAMLLELFNFILIDFWTGGLIALVNLSFSVLALVILMKTGRLKLLVVMGVSIISGLLVWYTLQGGGLYLKSTYWIALSISLLVLIRSIQLATGAAIAIVGFFLFLHFGGYSDFEQSVRGVDSSTVSAFGPLVTNIAFSLAFFGILYAFHLSTKLSLQLYTAELDEKQKHNEKLTRLLQELQQTQQALVASKNLVSLGKLTAGMAHEMNNPINSLKGSVQALDLDFKDLRPIFSALQELEPQTDFPPLLNQQIGDAKAKSQLILASIPAVHQIQANAQQIRKTIDTLQHFTYQSEDEFTPVPLGELLHSAFIVLGSKIRERQIEIMEYEGPTLPMISCQTGRINQAFAILIGNFIDTIPSATSLETRANIQQDQVLLVLSSPIRQALPKSTEAVNPPSLQYVQEIIAEHQGKILQIIEADSSVSLHLHFPIAHF
ncbi:MAG: hypothetical protein KTR30_25070 [Saprospiraceae bacterium]|nr:hypothetical protein [Saprospiraceae bacterium]